MLGESALINVYVPPDYATSGTRYPVLYMPDGGLNEDFPHVTGAVDSLVKNAAIRPLIVVGVKNTQRRRDLIGPTTIDEDSTIAPHAGGADKFRAFLRDELLPLIAARYRTTAESALIVGESFAGLFVLETFVLEPTLFDHYIALDPSVWWNSGALVDSAPALLARAGGANGATAVRKDAPAAARARSLFVAISRDDRDDIGPRFAAAFRDAAARGLAWTYVPRPDLTHATIFRAAGPGARARPALGARQPRPDGAATSP